MNQWQAPSIVHQPHTLDATEASALDNMMTILRQVQNELTYSDVKFMRTALHSVLVDVDVRRGGSSFSIVLFKHYTVRSITNPGTGSAMGHIIDQIELILDDVAVVENGAEKLRHVWCNDNKDVWMCYQPHTAD